LVQNQKAAIKIRAEFTLKGAATDAVRRNKTDNFKEQKLQDRNLLKQNLDLFKQEYPLIEQYQLTYTKSKVLPKAHLESPDIRFCTVLMLILFMICTSVSLFLTRDIVQNYWWQELITD